MCNSSILTRCNVCHIYNGIVQYAEKTIGNYQNVFRVGWGTTDNIFMLRQIIDKAYEYNIN